MQYNKPIINSFLGLSLSHCPKPVSGPAQALSGARLLADQGLIKSVELWMTGFPPSSPQNPGPWDYTDELINDLRSILDSFIYKGAHIPFAFINAAALNPGIRRESIRQLYQSVEIAGKLGLDYVVTHPRFGALDIISKAEEWNLWKESYLELSAVAEANKIIFTIENGDRLSFEDCARMVREIASPFFAMTFDTGHANLEGNKDKKYQNYHDLASFVKGEAACFANIHLHDNHTDKDEHLPPGEGHIDFAGIFRELCLQKWKGPLTLECPWDSLNEISEKIKAWHENYAH
ncbi:MAG TPA: hypothetical protein DC049_02515 [Spirochaetia bacterium]|nr:hypothetical protein [Spirochaetia bacterium]